MFSNRNRFFSGERAKKKKLQIFNYILLENTGEVPIAKESRKRVLLQMEPTVESLKTQLQDYESQLAVVESALKDGFFS